MSLNTTSQKEKKTTNKKKKIGLYSTSLISRKIKIIYNKLGGNIKEIFHRKGNFENENLLIFK